MKRVEIPEDQIEPLNKAISIWKDRSLGKGNNAECPLCVAATPNDSHFSDCYLCIYGKSAGFEGNNCTEAWREWDGWQSAESAERVFNELTWIKENQL